MEMLWSTSEAMWQMTMADEKDMVGSDMVIETDSVSPQSEVGSDALGDAVIHVGSDVGDEREKIMEKDSLSLQSAVGSDVFGEARAHRYFTRGKNKMVSNNASYMAEGDSVEYMDSKDICVETPSGKVRITKTKSRK